ncbi:hypothetical protein PGT21_002421 [Puccinia graminis f. sp. tritici]|uniref:Uncharacterized protein n=1 Tax=Puccinia graminis f. sp. tritici TaxID=56615 RepID=A0A5B0NCU3_PUCGR|nr:hypothetical protein PGT21_002421 [Puccinia graminis f. sp. tritici]
MSLKGLLVDSRLTVFPHLLPIAQKAIIPNRSTPLPKQLTNQPILSTNPFTFPAKTSFRSFSSFSSHLSYKLFLSSASFLHRPERYSSLSSYTLFIVIYSLLPLPCTPALEVHASPAGRQPFQSTRYMPRRLEGPCQLEGVLGIPGDTRISAGIWGGERTSAPESASPGGYPLALADIRQRIADIRNGLSPPISSHVTFNQLR